MGAGLGPGGRSCRSQHRRSSGGGGGSSGPAEPSSPSPYPGSALHGERGHHPPPETKYEPSHSPTGQAGIISSDNGLQYANLDGSGEAALKSGYPAGGYPAGHPHQASYQAHHASLVQASYAHHYGKGFVSSLRSIPATGDLIRKLIINLPLMTPIIALQSQSVQQRCSPSSSAQPNNRSNSALPRMLIVSNHLWIYIGLGRN